MPDDRPPSLYLHDTGWPHPGKLDAYVDALGSVYFPQTEHSRMIQVDACLVVCPGTGRGQEVVLLQRVLDWPAFSRLLTEGGDDTRVQVFSGSLQGLEGDGFDVSIPNQGTRIYLVE